MAKHYEMILAIINAGFSDSVMDAARREGATGGTVLRGRGTANKDAEKFFGITIQPEKEAVLLVVSEDIRDAILHAIYRECGLDSPAHGIAFSLPVTDTAGLPKLED